MTYDDEVDAQVKRNGDSTGWSNGEQAICDEVAEECVDVSAWLRGLDGYPMTAEQQGLIDTITGDAALLFYAVQELKATYL